jgi:hypothetical protein
MEELCSLQECIDESKGAMPTGVVTSLMAECQKVFHAMPKLYRLTWVKVKAHAHINEEDEPQGMITSAKQTLLVEAVNYATLEPRQEGMKLCVRELPDHGMMDQRWADKPMPYVLLDGQDGRIIITSVVPFVSKRKRSE